MFCALEIKKLREDIAAAQALIDQAQAYYNDHHHTWTNVEAWNFQADLDRHRFKLETQKLTVNMLSKL